MEVEKSSSSWFTRPICEGGRGEKKRIDCWKNSEKNSFSRMGSGKEQQLLVDESDMTGAKRRARTQEL